MKKIVFIMMVTLLSLNGYAQHDNISDIANNNFYNILNVFIQFPTNSERNEYIYNDLNELQKSIKEIIVTREERYKLNSLEADIEVVKKFISPISNKYNAHLSASNISRLQRIFGDCFTRSILKVKCPSNEIEFVEIKVGSLIICYFHCTSKDINNGIRVKYSAHSGNNSASGEFGALKNEYTPIIHNVDRPYVKIQSASIISRF